MSINNQHKPGYKHTPLGWIPEEWEIHDLGNLITIISGDSPANYQLFSTGKYPYIKVEDLNNNDKYQIVSREYSNEEKRTIPTGSTIFPKRGAAILNNKVRISSVPLYMDSNLMAIYPSNGKVDNEFLYYKIKQKALYKIADTSTIPQINNKHIIPLRFELPKIKEQRSIAAILSTWDEAITITQQIIAQLQQRNKGLMQQLLSGKKKLKGFDADWKEVLLGDVFTERNETGYINLNLLSIGSMGVYPQSQSEKRDISNTDKSKYKRICSGDIGYNTMRMWQGRSALSSMEGIVSPAYTIVTPKDQQHSEFYTYLFKLPSVVNKFYRNSQGLVEDTLNCKFKDLAIVKVEVPVYNEQVAIAQVIQKATDGVKLYEQKLAALQQQKKGLMQKLLTGEVRVKIDNKKNL
jgi:type I restriction enzyme, S subunit